MSGFRNELRQLMNYYCKENGSNTPDFILVEYLESCLSAFDRATQGRDRWYGVDRTQTPQEVSGISFMTLGKGD
jgi:hypothetical protein